MAARAFVLVEELRLPGTRYFRMPSVRDLVGEEAHVIRHWHAEFAHWVRPQKSRSRHRLFSARDVKTLWVIKHLLHECGFTTDGARRILGEGRWAFTAPGAVTPQKIMTVAEEAAFDAAQAAKQHEAEE